MRKSSNRARTVWRLIAVGIVVAGALTFLVSHGNGRSKSFNEGWNYVIRSFKMGNDIGHSGASLIDCWAAANAAIPSGLSYGMRTQASYKKVSQWSQGCTDALQAVQSNGLNGVSIPLQ